MGSPIANVNFEISITQLGVMVPGGVIGVPPTVTESDLTVNESSAADAPDGDNVVVNQMTELPAGMIATLGCKSPGYAGGTGADAPITLGAVTIPAGSTTVKCNGDAVHIEGDSGNCSCSVTYTPPSPGTPVVVNGSCRFEITNAGQDKAEAI